MEKASGAQRDRPELKAALDYLRAGDTLAVWKLDRLARSVRQLVETAEDLAKREIGLPVVTGIMVQMRAGEDHARDPQLRGRVNAAVIAITACATFTAVISLRLAERRACRKL